MDSKDSKGKTAEEEEPPAYSPALAASSSDRPPAYQSPSSYRVGSQKLKNPLVQVHELKAHLCLLRAFRNLRTVVEDGKIAEWPEIPRMWAPSQRWAWFVGLAVERFQAWIKSTTAYSSVETWVQREMPPVDVLMVWHAYLLNPMWYAEDTTRIIGLRSLRAIKDRLLTAIVHVRDINTFEPSQERKDSWLKSCGTPFDPIAAPAVMWDRNITCPGCLTAYGVPLITEDGTGYLQSQFKATCPQCSVKATKESLGVLKFARDMTLDPRSHDDKQRFGQNVYMAGTLRTLIDPVSEGIAGVIKAKMHIVFKAPEELSLTTKDEWAKWIAANAEYKMENIEKRALYAFTLGVSAGQRRVKRVTGAYIDDRPFSVELVGAVIRQCSFIDKMTEFGWTPAGAFDQPEDEVVLHHAIARYHAFLDLMSSAPGSFFVPTLDIDLAWHTHQLKGELYHNDCIKLIRRFIDHDDRVEENHLATSFDVTCRAWQQRYNVPYSYCGCPLPGDTLGQRLSRLKHRLSLSGGGASALVPPRRADARGATHASEHNSVSLAPLGESFAALADSKRRLREEKIARRRERDERLVREGKLDPDAARACEGHQVAFLYPVPFYAPPVAGCVAGPAGCGAFAGFVPMPGVVAACAVGAGACGGGQFGGGGGAFGVCGGSSGGSCSGGGCGGGGGGCGGGGGGGGGGCGGC